MFSKQVPFCLGLILLVFYCAKSTGQSTGLCDSMTAQMTCEGCIAAHPDCVWCTFNQGQNASRMTTVIHCYNATTYDSSLCSATLESPISTVMKIRDVELSNQTEPGVESVQVRPQEVKMRLRQGSPQSFDMSFVALRNTPLDVYFLLDVSGSLVTTFRAIRDNLEAIAASLGGISSAFRIGIGGFIDKDVFPFAGSFSYERIFGNDIVCGQALPDGTPLCDPPLGYHHYLSLTDNISSFQEVLNQSIGLSVNVDVPEGGLDALMQAAVCRDVIGWRRDALKMLFFITDSDYHIAGDGYLAGLVKPNDGQCHMERIPDSPEIYEYTYSTVQDYPSIRQVLRALEREVIVPIFAIQASSSGNLETYTNLAMELQRVQSQAIAIEVDAGNRVTAETIINLIENAYNETSQTLQVVNPAIDGYEFTVEPLNCPRNGTVGSADSGCRVLFDETIVFRVTVELTECSVGRNETIELRGAPYTFSTIQLEPVCDCGCSAPEFREANSSVCNENGTLVCGACQCNEGLFGDFCECDSFVQECPSSINGEECGGPMRGVCSTCGECMCNPPFFDAAKECSCSLDDCPANCTANNGVCVCLDNSVVVCQCNSVGPISGQPFVGPDCSCNPDVCFNPNWMSSSGERAMLCQFIDDEQRAGTCGNRGNCQCNCGGNFIPRGGLCVPNDPEVFCDFFEECVSCTLRGEETCPTTARCTNYRFQMPEEEIDSGDYRTCTAESNGCQYTFFVARGDPLASAVIIDQGSESCPSISLGVAVGIAVGIVGAVVIIGLLILCLLKIAFVIWDKHEYSKFTQELQEADFAPHENPLYLTPQQDYVNPILRRHSSKRKQ